MCDCGDGPEAFWERHSVAKKWHRCNECGGHIQPGERYWAVRGIWEGDAQSFKTCSECEDLQNEASDRNDCLCYSFGETHQNIVDLAGDEGDERWTRYVLARIADIRMRRRALLAA